MSTELYGAFVLATVALMLLPGPNVALIVATSAARGARYGLATVAGTTTAMVLQLGIVVGGISGLLAVMADAFTYLRWLGVAYLVYLGWRAWTASAGHSDEAHSSPRSMQRLFLGGFLVSLSNPKTLLFLGAFLPQFVDPSALIESQLLLLAGTFLLTAIVIDSAWALLAARLRTALAVRREVVNRVTAGLLWAAAAGLALARRT